MPLPGFFNRPVAPQQPQVAPVAGAVNGYTAPPPVQVQQPVAQPHVARPAVGFRPAPVAQAPVAAAPAYAAPVAVPVQPAFQQQGAAGPLTRGAGAGAPVQLSFAGAGSARKRNTRPDPLRQGHYALRLDRTRQDAPQGCQPLVSFIFTVVHVFDDANGQGHKPGDCVEHTIFKDRDPRYDYFFVELRESICGMLTIDAEYSDELVASIFGPKQPLSAPAPIVVVAHVRIKPPKPKKGEPQEVFEARMKAGLVKTNYYRDYKGRLKSTELAQIMPLENQTRFFGAIDPQHGVAQGLVAMAIQEAQDDAAQAPADEGAPPPPPPA